MSDDFILSRIRCMVEVELIVNEKILEDRSVNDTEEHKNIPEAENRS